MTVYGKYSMIQHEAKLSAVFVLRHPRVLYFSVHMSLGGALTGAPVVLRKCHISPTYVRMYFLSKSSYIRLPSLQTCAYTCMYTRIQLT